jgi:hypothetical protein
MQSNIQTQLRAQLDQYQRRKENLYAYGGYLVYGLIVDEIGLASYDAVEQGEQNGGACLKGAEEGLHEAFV